MDVFYASDDRYAQHLGVSISSVLTHSKFSINFYILDGGISEFKKSVIFELLNNSPLSKIEFIPVDNDIFDDFPCSERFTVASYYRCIIHELKPEIDKAIYLDCDVVANCCLEEFFAIDLEENYAAVVEDFNILMDERKAVLDLPVGSRYFNSGVLLLNLKKIRTDAVFSKILPVLNKYENFLDYYDQDLLNILFFGKVKFVEPWWNVMEIVFRKNGMHCQNRFYKNEKFKYYNNNPKIIHYANRSTLWFDGASQFLHKFWRDYYWYYKKTKFNSGIRQSPCFLFLKKQLKNLTFKKCKRWILRIHLTSNRRIIRIMGLYIVDWKKKEFSIC